MAKSNHCTVAAEHREPREFNLAQNLIFQTFYCPNKHYDKWSLAYKQCFHGSASWGSEQKLCHQMWWRFESHLGILIIFQIFPNFKGKFWLSGKNRELNILFILIWTHQISVLHRSQPCSLMPSHGHFLTLKALF